MGTARGVVINIVKVYLDAALVVGAERLAVGVVIGGMP